MKYSLFFFLNSAFFLHYSQQKFTFFFTLFAGPSWTFRSCTLLWWRILQNNNQLCYYCWRGKNDFILNIFETRPIRRASTLIRSVSNGDGDGYENVTWKVKSRYFKIYRAYSISFNSSNVGNFFWSWILKDCIEVQEKKKKVAILSSRPPQNVKLGSFTS